jgi:hypothetical protein
MSRSAEGQAETQADAQGDAFEHRALVPVREIDPRESPSPCSRRPAAPFLAHLIATARGEAQTRQLRRADPDAAAQAYAATLRLDGTNPRKS